MLAQIARREAMAGFADAVSEEVRSTTLAKRSKELLFQYNQMRGADDASALRDQATFVRSLQQVADQAERARLDAGDQAAWQARALAAADDRASRSEKRLKAVRRELEAALAKREQPTSKRVARKLQSEEGHQNEAGHGARSQRTRN